MNMWDSIFKFEATTGGIYWAENTLMQSPTVGQTVQGFQSIESLEQNEQATEVIVKKLLAPLPNPNSPIICIGVNYRDHAREAKIQVPEYPVMWYKPPTALSNPDEGIEVPQFLFDSFLDYEGELVIVTSKTVKNIAPPKAKECILGYTIGNDLSARAYQSTKAGGGQYTYAKSFDKFAPIGPVLLRPKQFDLQCCRIETRVNGNVMQSSKFDFLHSPENLISFLSKGTTIPAGTAIMTGTPAGVGVFRKPPCQLKRGDVVEVEVQPIGVLRNEIVLEAQARTVI
ncbi:uncharacterized protein PV09_05995 [Verruconis gallopava]|uniref:Fumarylacetoacetase-like C-terminal domain-containing protein n=1 Tax=Verruconis gallopava TaxID=253628 RepID=A0A0D2A743_9PEZI|nr:uncharacterized protein PV09_05995 [Verruconis gallopava]KIW02538.1 hypothetical protein PV09_05995 [Verruconis gallopava]